MPPRASGLPTAAVYPPDRPARWRTPAVAIALVTLAGIAAACGSPSAGVAHLGATTTTTTATSTQSGAGKAGGALVEYAQCMQHHGLPAFPLPTRTSTGYSLRIGPGTGVDPRSPKFQTAQDACHGLLPGKGIGPTITPADQADYLRAVACMRSHGFPAFPDPSISKNQVHFTVPPGIDQSSNTFKAAVATCQKLIPAGLPYSGTD